MKRMLILMLVMSLAVPTMVLAGTTQCSKYHLKLEGGNKDVPLPGYSYKEILEMHKVGQSSGYDGRWQIDKFTQIITYPHIIEPSVSSVDSVNFGHGFWMTCAGQSAGNVITNVCTGGETYLDVVGNRIGSKITGIWSGTITGKQVKFRFDPSNESAPLLTGEIRQPEKRKLTLSIVEPLGEKFAFTGFHPGILEMEFVAKVTPAEYEPDIQWTVPEIQGSTRTIDPPSAKGPRIKVTFKGLPEDNNQFGVKTVQAVVNVGGCTTSETKQVKVFYLRDAKNNPGGQYPNWFYYWKQTPAGKPRGQMVNIEYGGKTFGECVDPKVTAQYTPGYGHATIHVCDLSSKGPDFHNRFPLLSIYPPYHNGWDTAKYIDTFATAVIHEFTHWQAYHNWREGKTDAEMEAADTDKDGLPDSAEPDYYFDPTKFQTHFANHPELKRIGGDEEWLAYASMSEIQLGSLDKYDWAWPGKNWPQ